MSSIEAADPSLRQASRRLLPKVVVREKGTLGLMVLTVLLGLLSIVCIGTGAVSIGPSQVLAILGKGLDLTLPWAFEPHHEAIVLSIRLPRILLGILIGGGLAVAGAAMQGLFRNPLADPGLIGVSSGAAVAAVGDHCSGSDCAGFRHPSTGAFCPVHRRFWRWCRHNLASLSTVAGPRHCLRIHHAARRHCHQRRGRSHHRDIHFRGGRRPTPQPDVLEHGQPRWSYLAGGGCGCTVHRPCDPSGAALRPSPQRPACWARPKLAISAATSSASSVRLSSWSLCRWERQSPWAASSALSV